MILSASILSADFAYLADQIHTAEEAGVDWIHLDIMDGSFVPNIALGPVIVETVKRITHLPLDVHLMINQPDRHLDAFAKAGADWISVHIENNYHIHRTLQQIKSLGCKAGIVLNPGTPAEAISETLSLVDLVLVMSVNPGFSGQKFIPQVCPKTTRIRSMIETAGSSTLLEMDGGITAKTLPIAQAAGVQVFVAATAIFNYPSGITAGVQALRKAAL